MKKKDFKKPFPMRFSDGELAAFKQAAGDRPLREWMRHTLLAATPAYQTLSAMLDKAVGITPPARGTQPKALPASTNRLAPAPLANREIATQI
ncbi:MAG TPA: hypothetical protein VG734_02410 [Lacunisphaera sp.]|nr:hypothetical protein [Lacunisphaera sp.]